MRDRPSPHKTTMIQISESAQTHFRKLIEREAIPGLGVRLAARDAGTPRADVRLEFAESGELSQPLAASPSQSP